jgi:hypothetical protein
LLLGQPAQGLGNLLLPLVAAVKVDQSGAGGGVAHPVHQFPESCSSSRRQLVAGMPQIMK